MSAGQPAETSKTPAGQKKPLSAGRIIIGALLVLLAIEAVPYVRMKLAYTRLMMEMQKTENEDHRLRNDTVKKIIGDQKPDLSKMKQATVGEERYDVYYYDGLLGRFLTFLPRRQICIHYGVRGLNDPEGSEEVVEITTVVPEEILFEDEPVAQLGPKGGQPSPADARPEEQTDAADADAKAAEAGSEEKPGDAGTEEKATETPSEEKPAEAGTEEKAAEPAPADTDGADSQKTDGEAPAAEGNATPNVPPPPKAPENIEE